jgi:isoleucyl-tRNA synthetase
LVKSLRLKSPTQIAYESGGESKNASIELDDLIITETPRSGWSVSSHNGESVALDLTLTPDLIKAGLVREAIRAIQEERKRIGLEISDRITVNWNAPTELAQAINGAIEEISAEVLAIQMIQISAEGTSESEIGLWLKLEKN